VNSQDLVAERREEKSQRMSQAKKEEKNSVRKLAWKEINVIDVFV